ncbi:MAG: hypothetical protein FNP40_13395 [Dehalobacter sp. 4CP]|uniref:hypothetical protein n=1 Tax=Dehalobacter sp. CP TaxID=2594474 RepID=UPI0013C898F4|nr:hypothetical protein [Dehalobacter sp. 4CP]
MKKIICMSLIVLMAIFSAVPAYAAIDGKSVSTQGSGTVSPLFTYILQLNVGLEIDSSGKAACLGKATLYSGTNRVDLTVQLQKFTGSSWSAIKTWTSSGVGMSGTTILQNYYVVSGTYRVSATAKVYNSSGNLLETATAYSPTATY